MVVDNEPLSAQHHIAYTFPLLIATMSSAVGPSKSLINIYKSLPSHELKVSLLLTKVLVV